MWRFGRQQPASSQPQKEDNPVADAEHADSGGVEKLDPDPTPAATPPEQQDQAEQEGEEEPGVHVVRRTRFEQVLSHFLHALPVRRLHDLILGPAALSCMTPLWLLGVCYHAEPATPDSDDLVCAEFLRDYQSRLWFTYRKDFEPLGDARLTSDVGWGCMLRSGQMLLAQAIVCQRLSRAWRCRADGSGEEEERGRLYRLILSRFGDASTPSAPFSVHNLVRAGRPHGLAEGAWLGPYALCRTLEALARAPGPARDALSMAVYVVASDADGQRGGAPVLSIADVARVCDQHAAAAPSVHTQGSGKDRAESQDGSSRDLPVLILVPLVLGVESVNPRYLPSLRAVFQFPYSVGVLGGKPGASTYLVGVQDDSAFYLDPHEVQPVAPVSLEDASAQTSSYHCSMVRKMPLNAIDSSIALGFYCQTHAELVDLCHLADKVAKESNGAPMFTVASDESPTSREAPDGAFHGMLRLSDDGLPAELSSDSHTVPKLHEEGDWQIV